MSILEPEMWRQDGPNLVIEGDNLPVLQGIPSDSFQLIYIDPPFNTGKIQSRVSLKTRKTSALARGCEPDSKEAVSGQNPGQGKIAIRRGFKGQTYETIRGRASSYNDEFEDYWGFLEPRLKEAYRLLAPTGTLYLHLDYREVHYAKVALDGIFGRDCFLNEIIWAYDYGGRSKKKWPAKHDNILVYVKDSKRYYFDCESVDREPYMAPGLVTPEKAARGKLPTDVWWHTIVSPTGKEKTGYATQKPEGILRRIIEASSREGDWVLDFFAGSGTTGAVAGKLGRRFVMVDENPEAVAIQRTRLAAIENLRKTAYRKIGL